jgi:glutathione S-transferase
MRLVTISTSHFCEKARWALDRLGLSYTEERHLPVFHQYFVRRAGGGLTVPVLVTDEEVVADSTDILQWLDHRAPEPLRLYPADAEALREAEDLEELYDSELGPHTRRWAYFHLIKQRDLMPLLLDGVGVWEQRLFRGLLPLVQFMLRRVLNLTPQAAERSRERIESVFESVEKRLDDGRRFLMGGRFQAVDLTFAALAAPVLFPADHGAGMPRLDQVPPAMAEQVEAWRRSPAGLFALRVYREERRRRPEDHSR